MENTRVDLHIHSIYSDGIYSIDEIINMLKTNRISYVSITDHNDIRSIKHLENYSNDNDIKFIPGVEISTVYNNQQLHMLGYYVDTSIESFLLENRKNIEAELIRILRGLSQEYTILSEEDYRSYLNDPKRGGWKLLNYLFDKGICKTGDDYLRLVESKMNYNVLADLKKVIKEIKRANGIAILAHPTTYCFKNLRGILQELVEMGLDGVECYHPYISKEDEVNLVEFCDEYNIIITGGSDYHGNLPDRKIGYPNITESDINLRYKSLPSYIVNIEE